MILSLRSTSYTAALFIAIILSVLLLLGSRQYRSQKHFERIIEQNEKIIFQFATIREHISESLLESRYSQLKEITGEVEKLNANISQILQEPFIPDQYKLSFMGQVDLAGVILLLRNIGAGEVELTKVRQLNQEIRVLGDRLMLFDRVVVNHVKRELVNFQSVVIGILAIVLFIVIYLLLFFHRHIALPLFGLIKQTNEVMLGKRKGINRSRKTGEVAELAASFQQMLTRQGQTVEELSRFSHILSITRRFCESVWDIGSRDIMFAELCRTLLSVEDYCLVWIGMPDKTERLSPVVADGSTTMSSKECDECLAVLLAAAKEKGLKHDAAGQAVKNKKPVVLRDILSETPKGPLKNTPFASGFANCAAFPLLFEQKLHGVLTIYSVFPMSFTEQEVNLLIGLTAECVCALHDFERKAQDISQERTHKNVAIKTSKLAAMGELAVGVANEINNLCNGLINYTQILSDEIADTGGSNTQQLHLLGNVIKNGEDIAHIVQQLLSFNTKRSHLVESVHIEKVIEESLSLLKHQFKHDGILARTDFAQDLPIVRVNAQKMQHVFLNILNNARYALNQRYSGQNSNKRLEIKTESFSEEERQWLRIRFTDWGTGIQEDIIERLFDPFFTTKPEGEGTGLGLSICSSLVQENNGKIRVESVFNDHTTIVIDLPVA